MDDREKKAWASAYQNADMVRISTVSGHGLLVDDPQGKETLLGNDADDAALGVAVKEALARSRFLPLDEAREFLDYKRVEQRYEERTKVLMERYGYKNKAALFRGMKRCGITLSNGVITIAPTVHEGSDSWRRNKSDELDDVVIAANRSAAEIGAALKLGFSRCVA